MSRRALYHSLVAIVFPFLVVYKIMVYLIIDSVFRLMKYSSDFQPVHYKNF